MNYIQIIKALFLMFLLGLTILSGILFATTGIDYIVNHEKYPDKWSLILLSGVVTGFGIGLLLILRKNDISLKINCISFPKNNFKIKKERIFENNQV